MELHEAISIMEALISDTHPVCLTVPSPDKLTEAVTTVLDNINPKVDILNLDQRIDIVKNSLADLQLRSLELGYDTFTKEKVSIQHEIDCTIKTLNALEVNN